MSDGVFDTVFVGCQILGQQGSGLGFREWLVDLGAIVDVASVAVTDGLDTLLEFQEKSGF